MNLTLSTNRPFNKVDLLPHVVPGTWNIGPINLPDFGITEALGITKPAPSIGPDVRGANTSFFDSSVPGPVSNTSQYISHQKQATQGSSIPAVTDSTGGSVTGGGGGGAADTLARMDRGEIPWDDNLRAQLNASMSDINAEIENAFNATMNYAGGLEGSLRDQDVATRNMINQEYTQSQGALERERGLGEEKIGMQEAQGGRVKEDALTAARRLYNELSTGGQQRFGGASSAGEAFQALGGRELQRNNAQIQQNYSSFMEQINYAKNELQNKVISATENIELQKNKALESANTLFRNALSEINRIKAGAAEDKAQRRLGALQDYRNQLVQISMAEAEMKNQISNYANQTNSVLDGYIQQASQSVGSANQAGQTLGETTPLNYTTGLGISVGRGPAGFDTQTGAINFRANPDEEEQLIQAGQIAPRDDIRSQLGFFGY